jgi:hypothetical protein
MDILNSFLYGLYEILFNVLNIMLGIYAGLNDFIFNTGIFGFSFGSIISLVPDQMETTIFFFMERFGITTVINLYTLFFSMKALLRLVPIVNRLF